MDVKLEQDVVDALDAIQDLHTTVTALAEIVSKVVEKVHGIPCNLELYRQQAAIKVCPPVSPGKKDDESNGWGLDNYSDGARHRTWVSLVCKTGFRKTRYRFSGELE